SRGACAGGEGRLRDRSRQSVSRSVHRPSARHSEVGSGPGGEPGPFSRRPRGADVGRCARSEVRRQLRLRRLEQGAHARRARRAPRTVFVGGRRPFDVARLIAPMDPKPLQGRVALVTGAGRNIGRAIALALADAGARLAVNVRASRAEGQSVVDEIAARSGEALLAEADVTNRAQVDAMIAAVA